jgi:thiol-disulfide isomerase/thioredoxin
MKSNKLITLAGLLVALLVAGFFYNKYRVAPKIKLASIELTDLEGRPFSLDTFRNKKLFINFFATWCGPCMKELPSILNAQTALTPEGFQFVFISDESEGILQTLNDRAQGNFLILHSTQKLQEYNIYTIPTTYVVSTNREILLKQTGVEDWGSEKALARLRAL